MCKVIVLHKCLVVMGYNPTCFMDCDRLQPDKMAGAGGGGVGVFLK